MNMRKTIPSLIVLTFVACADEPPLTPVNLAKLPADAKPCPAVPVKSISAAMSATFAVLEDGSVCGWGDGLPIDREAHSPELLPALARVVQVAGGYQFACARNDDGAVSCWGNGEYGATGVKSEKYVAKPSPIAGLSATAIAAGEHHACALLADGSARCWGRANFGQLGDGSKVDKAIPSPVAGITDAESLACGFDTCCVTRKGGSVACWGIFAWEEGERQHPTPVEIPGVTGAKRVVVGPNQGCAFSESGDATCWGSSVFAELGGREAVLWPPRAAPDFANAKQIAFTYETAIWINESGTTFGRGMNASGELGIGEQARYRNGAPTITVPRPLALHDAVELAASRQHLCARLASGSVVCAGANSNGQLGNGPTGVSSARMLVALDRRQPATSGSEPNRKVSR